MPEREVKLAPRPGFRMPSLAGLEGPTGLLAATPPEELLLQSTYYDTADLRLARSGVSVRYRSDDGWTVKLPDPPGELLLVRTEHHFPGGPSSVPAGVTDLVRAFARTARLVVATRLRTRRSRVELLDPEGKQIAEIVDDEVSVLDGRRVAARFRELEVELAEPAPDELATEIVERLRASGVGAPDPTPKVVRALGPQALEPPDVLPNSRLLGRDPAGEVVRTAIATSVARLIEHDPGVRLGHDPEFVHQARVATRRLRSDLRTFRSLLDPEWNEGLRDELRWLGAELGAVRDAEVLLELLRAKERGLPDTERSAAAEVVGRMVARWEDARRELLLALRSPRYASLLDRLVEASHTPVLTADADAHAGETLPRLVAGPWRHLEHAVDALLRDPPNEALHDIRIRAKRARYAAEAVAPIVGKRARVFARAVAGVQDVLGRHHDAVVAAAWLREVAADTTGSEAFAAGEMAGLVLCDERDARAEWRRAWKTARRKQLRDWFE